MHISTNGILLIKRFEGISLKRYLDSVGVPTIGFGTTEGDLGHPVPEFCTLAQAEDWLRAGMAKTYEPPINAVIAGGVKLNQNQFDALCSLSYNCGPGVISDTAVYQMARDLRSGQLAAAADDFLHYEFAGGQRLAGLVTRRTAERVLFLTPWVDPDPHHYGWMDSTVRDLGHGHTGSERALAQEYDAKRQHPFVHRARLSRLRDDMGILAGRLETVMHDDPAGDVAERRQWRHDQMAGRADGRRYV